MKHSRKMIKLVPQDSVGKLLLNEKTLMPQNYEISQKNATDTVQTLGIHLTKLDAEMNEILNSQDGDKGEKWKKY